MDIAIIDSGIDSSKTTALNNIKGIAHFQYNVQTNKVEMSHDCITNNKHGTLIINTIEKYKENSTISYYIFNIMDNQNRGSSESIYSALSYICSIESIRIVIMSLTFRNLNNREKIEQICIKLQRKGVVLLASDSNNNQQSFPASFNSVWGVGRGGFRNKQGFIYHINNRIQIVGDILPEFIYENDGRYKVFSGTSKAAAKFVPILTHFLLKYEWNEEAWRGYLQATSLENKDNVLPYLEKEEFSTIKLKEGSILNQVIYAVNIFKESHGEADFIINKKGNISIYNVLNNESKLDLLIIKLLKQFGSYKQISELDFMEFKTLYDLTNFLAG